MTKIYILFLFFLSRLSPAVPVRCIGCVHVLEFDFININYQFGRF